MSENDSVPKTKKKNRQKVMYSRCLGFDHCQKTHYYVYNANHFARVMK